MPSPFPGMDPYLEGHLWPDVHSALAGKLRAALTPLIRPRYTARLAISVIEDIAPGDEIGIMYPDVEVLRKGGAGTQPPRQPAFADSASPATLTIPVTQPIEVRLVNIEIRDAAQQQLVTAIEILSPVNKREPGLTQYRQKRQRLYEAGVHLLELDLIRRGTRPLMHPRIPEVPYLVTLTRAHSGLTDVWALDLRTPLPTVPVPLRPPDDDVLLDLQAALSAAYDEAAYDLSIDYTQPPPPPALPAGEAEWARSLRR
jgi:hypothetical protein